MEKSRTKEKLVSLSLDSSVYSEICLLIIVAVEDREMIPSTGTKLYLFFFF